MPKNPEQQPIMNVSTPEQPDTNPTPETKKSKIVWSKEGTEKGKKIAIEISSLMTEIEHLEDQGRLKEATKLLSQVKILLNQLESLRDEEAKVWDRVRLIKWAKEEVGEEDEEKWVDETFVIQDNEIKVAGDLQLQTCKSLKSLPANLSVSGYLDLESCKTIVSLHDNLSVSGNFYFGHGTALKSLPDNLSVGRNLYLGGCISLTSLPDNLSVGKDLNIEYCTSLESLPDNLSVGGALYLSENAPESLKQDAEKLKADGKIKGEIKEIQYW